MQEITTKLNESTLDMIFKLELFFRAKNKADVIVRAIHLTYMIASEMATGNKILIQLRNGSCNELIFSDNEMKLTKII